MANSKASRGERGKFSLLRQRMRRNLKKLWAREYDVNVGVGVIHQTLLVCSIFGSRSSGGQTSVVVGFISFVSLTYPILRFQLHIHTLHLYRSTSTTLYTRTYHLIITKRDVYSFTFIAPSIHTSFPSHIIIIGIRTLFYISLSLSSYRYMYNHPCCLLFFSWSFPLGY